MVCFVNLASLCSMFGASEADSSARDFSELLCIVSVSVSVCEQG